MGRLSSNACTGLSPAQPARLRPDRRTPAAPRVRGWESQQDDFCSQVLRGLRRIRKQLPCKFFYDRRGSELFDQICRLDEYYLTRTETEILKRNGAQMAEWLGSHCQIVEYGSGSSIKTRILLDHLHQPAGYVPLDISREHLMESAAALGASYPGLSITPICADYTRAFEVPPCPTASRTCVYFPGSTIGNFEPQDACAFLRATAQRCGSGGGLLIGVDLKKDPARLHAAYNDASGVTAQFNLNILRRINKQLLGDFDLARFFHHAFYNPRLGRVEMHLISRTRQTACVAGESFAFDEGESIFTESSYKYTIEQFQALATAAGWKPEHVWTDDRNWFSVHYFTTTS